MKFCLPLIYGSCRSIKAAVDLATDTADNVSTEEPCTCVYVTQLQP